MKQITEACWDGYKQVGMKDKGEKRSAITRKRKAGNPGGKPTMVSTFKKK
jgi:hypothetical protein